MKGILMNKKVLYWPGLGKDMKVLNSFRRELAAEGYQIDVVDFEYDKGSLNPNKWKQIQKNQYDWWIGISLGASLLYYSYNFVENSLRPKRLTLINPFCSRKILSEEKLFDMSKQWDFSPIDNLCIVDKIDVVISIYDWKIPIYHGIKLLTLTSSLNKYIIFLNSDHIVDNEIIQKELVKALITCEEGKKNQNEEKFNNCYIYKQQ